MPFLGFLLRLFLLAALLVGLAYSPGVAEIVWHDYQIKTSAAFLVFLFFVFSFSFFSLYRLFHFLRHGPRFWRLKKEMAKLKDGQEKFTQGLIAIASGDGVEAGRLAVASRKALGSTAATRLLQAQAAELAGDHRTARVLFLSLAEDPETMVLGYRGLIGQASRAQNWEEADRLIEKLGHLKPETPWLVRVRFDLATRRGAWVEAQSYIHYLAKLPTDESWLTPEHRAATHLALAEEKQKSGDAEGALAEAERARKIAPSWGPAFYALAEKQQRAGHRKLALRTLEKAWGLAPHPQMAHLYTFIQDEKNALQAFQNIEILVKKNREAPESFLALAEAALAADLWGEARRFLLALIEKGEATQRVYRLLAALEQRESGDARAASLWMAQAFEARSDARWLCHACGAESAHWQATCPSCSTFHAFSWRIPGVSQKTAIKNTNLLFHEDL